MGLRAVARGPISREALEAVMGIDRSAKYKCTECNEAFLQHELHVKFRDGINVDTCPLCGGDCVDAARAAKAAARESGAPLPDGPDRVPDAPPPGEFEPIEPSRPKAGYPPKVMACYGNAWGTMWPNFLMLFVISLVISGMILPFSILAFLAVRTGPVVPIILALAYTFLVVMPVLAFGFPYACLRAARGEEVKVGDAFVAFGNYLNSLAYPIVMLLIMIPGMLLSLIPVAGIVLYMVFFYVVTCRLVFVPFLMVDEGVGPLKAVAESWRISSGHGLTVFLITLLAMPVMLAGTLCLGVGVIPASYLIYVALASLYNAVR